MADNVSITPGVGVTVATDDVGGGVQIQRVRLDQGLEGSSSPVNTASPLAVGVDADSIALLRRIVKLLETLAVTDPQQRQRVTLDAITTGLILTTITNLGQMGGVNPEYLFMDTARNAYANGIRSNLAFS